MNIEQLSRQLDSVQGHIRAFDSKAQVVLGIDGVLAGFIAAQFSAGLDMASWHLYPLSICFIVFCGMALVSLLISVYWAVAAVFPRLKIGQPKSHFFFLHLVELYKDDFNKAGKALIDLSEEDQLHQLASQVHANAIIASAKASRSNKAILFMTTALLIFIVNLASLGALAYQAKNHSGGVSNSAPCVAR
jgi:hypothetical protein